MTAACAEIVRRDDPHLYATALFAPRAARERMLVLYALDCELSRATRASRESMIPRMRLQWWRDVITAALEDGDAPQHEVAGPLVGLIRSDPGLISDMTDLPGQDTLSLMIRGYEAELDLPFSAERFQNWTFDRFGARLGLAGSVMPVEEDQGHAADRSAATLVLGLGLAVRTAARMAVESGKCLLPDMAGADLAALARGDLTGTASARLVSHAEEALDALSALRKTRRLRGEALAAHLPVAREARVLARIVRDPGALFGPIDDVDRPFRGLGLGWRALRGRW